MISTDRRIIKTDTNQRIRVQKYADMMYGECVRLDQQINM